MDDFEWLDHTADIGVRVRAKTHAELFTQAAAAMFSVIARPAESLKNPKKEVFSIILEASDWDALLLDWLNELVSLSDSRGIIFTDFNIHKLSSTTLNAKVLGASRAHFAMERDVKAVTAHGLKIHESNKQLEVEVIFDV